MGTVLLDLQFSVSCFVDRCLSFFFWPLNCLSLFDLPLVSSWILSKCCQLRRNAITGQVSGSHKSTFDTAQPCAIEFEVILFSVRVNFRNKYHIASCNMSSFSFAVQQTKHFINNMSSAAIHSIKEMSVDCTNSKHCGRDRMVVGFITTCAISAYHY